MTYILFGGFKVDPNISSKHVCDLYEVMYFMSHIFKFSDLSRSLVKEKKEAKFLILSPSEKCQKVL